MICIYQSEKGWPWLAVSACLLYSAARIVAAADQVPAFTNEVGWTWHYGPSPMNGHGGPVAAPEMILQWYEGKPDELFLTWAYQERSLAGAVGWRPIAISPSGERFKFDFRSCYSTSNLNLASYRLDLKGFPSNHIQYIGIEKLTGETLENIPLLTAIEKLKAAGVEVPPLPRLGERYEFELTAADGKKIRSRDFHGKVVLLDFWASWCGPCLAAMPRLKELYSKSHSRGLEIIGINFDVTLADAKRAIAKQALPWPNIPGPVDPGHRQFWAKATGTEAIPRLLLIDPEGKVRSDLTPDDVKAEVEKLIAKP